MVQRRGSPPPYWSTRGITRPVVTGTAARPLIGRGGSGGGAPSWGVNEASSIGAEPGLAPPPLMAASARGSHVPQCTHEPGANVM